MVPFVPPPGYARIRVVTSFEALVATPFTNGCNAVCWQRTLVGDFDEVVRHLAPSEGVAVLDDELLQALPVSAAGRSAVDMLLADLQRLRAIGCVPTVECVGEYERDHGPVPTHVYSFHVDRADVPTDTYLCTYSGPASEGLRNDEAVRCVDLPPLRAQLLAQFGGKDGADFDACLSANCFDLHFAPTPSATPFTFGIANLWRLATQHPDSRVPACIHRAPPTCAGDPPRLLLIS
jgi:hypothetical protein